ncbi:uncharacterized protein BX663DRAFT_485624 [Cokeromyces recurvatus]|uniref:uncharacterized protein n=1 Tax=Cokeromyces recurvatus TaxID=90255 RepID=UPI00221F2135|nr:uncharacterized protein BX663DRAFT_485624 [Cokeromyces recurvatus]KAI7903470.1 hypothetical protein BX663DRAFT_485624 [Cokeromyces recurvatus]
MHWMRQISTIHTFKKVRHTFKEDTTFALPSVLANEAPSEADNPPPSAYSGRSIGPVSNPIIAYKRLGSILHQNNVRKELRANRYYEKPNVARRRKNIERNRKLFGAMVGKKVALIMQMKNRGI